MAIKKPSDLKEDPKNFKSVKQSPQKEETSRKTECCSGNPTCATPASSTTSGSKPLTQTSMPFSEQKKGSKTRVTVKYDVGFNNNLTIRGKGANLSWEKGINLKNVKPDEWVWETDIPFTTVEFKVLINDKHYEIGNNHTLAFGANIQYSPQF